MLRVKNILVHTKTDHQPWLLMHTTNQCITVQSSMENSFIMVATDCTPEVTLNKIDFLSNINKTKTHTLTLYEFDNALT